MSISLCMQATLLWVAEMDCRIGCGACCIAPSITSPIPGMHQGKPAGVRCIQLSSDNRCQLFGEPERPKVCASFKASEDVCGASYLEAMQLIVRLEKATGSDGCD